MERKLLKDFIISALLVCLLLILYFCCDSRCRQIEVVEPVITHEDLINLYLIKLEKHERELDNMLDESRILADKVAIRKILWGQHILEAQTY